MASNAARALATECACNRPDPWGWLTALSQPSNAISLSNCSDCADIHNVSSAPAEDGAATFAGDTGGDVAAPSSIAAVSRSVFSSACCAAVATTDAASLAPAAAASAAAGVGAAGVGADGADDSTAGTSADFTVADGGCLPSVIPPAGAAGRGRLTEARSSSTIMRCADGIASARVGAETLFVMLGTGAPLNCASTNSPRRALR